MRQIFVGYRTRRYKWLISAPKIFDIAHTCAKNIETTLSILFNPKNLKKTEGTKFRDAYLAVAQRPEP
jgi:hypothetical protein